MRLFVAVDMPAQVCEVVAEVQHYLKRRNLFDGSYTDAAHAHETIAFLGSVAEEDYAAIDAALCTVQPPVCQAQLGALDYFERGDLVKVIFLALVCPELQQLAQRVRDVLAPWHEPDSRPFHPHVTLARVKYAADHETLRRELVSYAVPRIEFPIDHFALKESVLTPDGPIHTTRALYPCFARGSE